jgi:hypothetical protein
MLGPMGLRAAAGSPSPGLAIALLSLLLIAMTLRPACGALGGMGGGMTKEQLIQVSVKKKRHGQPAVMRCKDFVMYHRAKILSPQRSHRSCFAFLHHAASI